MDQDGEILTAIIGDNLANLFQPYKAAQGCGAPDCTLSAGDLPFLIDDADTAKACPRLADGLEDLLFN